MTCIYTENITRLTRHNAHSTTHAPWHWYSTTHTHTHTHNLCTEHSTTQTHTHKVQHTEHTCQGVLFETVTCSVMSGHVSWFLDVLCDVKMCSVTSCVCVLWHHGVFCDVRACFLIPWCILWCQDVLCDIVCLCSLTSWCVLWCQGMFHDSLMYFVMSRCALWHHVFVFFDTMMCSVMSGPVSWFLDVLCDVKVCSVTSGVCVLWHHDVFCDVRVCSLIPWCTLCFQDVVCYTLMPLFLCPQGLTFTQWGRCSSCVCHRPARSFLFCSCVRFCLYGPFKLISFHKFSWQLSPSPLGSPGLISASLALSTMYLCMIVSFSPDIIVLSFMVDWAPSIN